MKDDEHPSDYIEHTVPSPPPPRPISSTPPGVKTAREYLHASVVLLALSGIIMLRFVDRLDQSSTLTAGAFVLALYFALKKGEGAPDTQSITDMMASILSQTKR